MAEYRTVYVDVVYVKTDLALQFVHFSPDNRDGHTYQNFTIQTFGRTHVSLSLVAGRALVCLCSEQVAFRSIARWTTAMDIDRPTAPAAINITRPTLHEIIRATDSTTSRHDVSMIAVRTPRN